ncbi:MAG: TonB-dependent receptor [Steroidobacteraceae bacterium]
MSKLIACLSGAIVTLASASGASAQSSSSEASGLELEEVVVTAERVTKDLQKTAQKLDVMEGTELKKQGKTRIDEILSGLPGIQLQGSQVDTAIYMRGISTGVPVTVDGVETSGVVLRGTTLDMAQVTVSRGVQNGAGTTGLTGAVSLTTNKPAFEYQATGALTVGSYNLRNTEGVLNLPFSDNQAVRVAYAADRRDGYVSNGAGNSDNRQFRLSYRWKPTDDLDINASYQENNINGNGVQAGSFLYTGHWINWTPGQTLNWSNPYTNGGTAQYQVYQSGLINSANAAGTAAPSATGGQIYNAAGQYLYPSGPCTTVATSFTSSATNFSALGPIIQAWGCPSRHLAIRDGVTFRNRANPWDDGSTRYDFFPNNPQRDSLTRVANVTIDWQTSYGKWRFQPAYTYSYRKFVEPLRGTSTMGEGGIPDTRWNLDVQLASNEDSRIGWVGGFTGSYTPRSDDGEGQFTVSYPTSGWTTGTPSTTLASGMAAAGISSAAMNPPCYTVFPGATPTSAGTANSLPCYSTTWSAGTAAYNYAFSLQGNYSITDAWRVNGSVRKDWYATENRGSTFSFFVDGDGQRYVWYLPATTYCSGPAVDAMGVAIPTGCTTTNTSGVPNPNGLYQVPVRMNISDADLYAQINSVHQWAKSNTESFTFSTEYDLLPDVMAYLRFANGTSAAMAAGMGGATGGSVSVTLPNAVVPGVGTPYTTTVNLPSPLVKGEETKQLTLGLKSRWFDRKLQVNVEGFYNEYHNRALGRIIGALYGYQNTTTQVQGTETCTASVSSPIVVRFGSTVQTSCFAANIGSYTGDMLSKGVDLDVTFVPTANDRIDLSVEYLRMTFAGAAQIGTLTVDQVIGFNQSTTTNLAAAQQFADGWNAFTSGTEGQTLPQAPRWSAQANYSHQFELPQGGRLTPRVTGYYKTAYYFNETTGTGDTNLMLNSNWAIANGKAKDQDNIQDAYSKFDVNLGYQPRDGKWSLNGYVKNVQNRATMTSANPTILTTGSVATGDIRQTAVGGFVQLDAPRTYGLTLQANF